MSEFIFKSVFLWACHQNALLIKDWYLLYVDTDIGDPTSYGI